MDFIEVKSGPTYVKQSLDPFTKRHKLVHNGGFTKIEVLYCIQ